MPNHLTASSRLLSAAKRSPAFGLTRQALAGRRVTVLLLGGALLAGMGMTLAVDRLESAARARAGLEQQTAALQQRLIPADPAVPALQQVRERYDGDIARAADLARGSIWASLLLLVGTLAWIERQRSRQPVSAQVGPSAPADAVDAIAQRNTVIPLPEPAPVGAESAAGPLTSPARERGERLGDIAREMRALRDWMGADPQGDAPAPQHRHQEAAVRSVRFRLAA